MEKIIKSAEEQCWIAPQNHEVQILEKEDEDENLLDRCEHEGNASAECEEALPRQKESDLE